ncbi:hypothetical protein BSLG_007145 [Batrachochytrium salamandrivorans]|nr:hypothetical protein BASA62_008985 [Batrachochytrium salamandrivorans]KAH6564948.1 hypothetical protein BASA60_010080 [Batrachochytrium salamandrivorans]KAJ1336361.1 hypothetical protein BSLG_007145 [Batrachochytrium salamandrivorans]
MPTDACMLVSSTTIAESLHSVENVSNTEIYNECSIDDALRHYSKYLVFPNDPRIFQSQIDEFCNLYLQHNSGLAIGKEDLLIISRLLISQEIARSPLEKIKKDIPMNKSEFVLTLNKAVPSIPAVVGGYLFENLRGEVYMGTPDHSTRSTRSTRSNHKILSNGNMDSMSSGGGRGTSNMNINQQAVPDAFKSSPFFWIAKLLRHDDMKLLNKIKGILSTSHIYPDTPNSSSSKPRLSSSSTKTITPRSSEAINGGPMAPSPSLSLSLAIRPNPSSVTPSSSPPDPHVGLSPLSLAIAAAVLAQDLDNTSSPAPSPTETHFQKPQSTQVQNPSNLQIPAPSTHVPSHVPSHKPPPPPHTKHCSKYRGSRERVRSLTTSPDDLLMPCLVKQAVLDQRCNSLIKIKYEALSGKLVDDEIIMSPRSTGLMLLPRWSKRWMSADGCSIVVFRDWKWFVKSRAIVQKLDIPARLISFTTEPKGKLISLEHSVAVYDPNLVYDGYHTFRIHFLKTGQTLSCRVETYDQNMVNQLICKQEAAAKSEQSIHTYIELLRRVRPRTISATANIKAVLQTELEHLQVSHIYMQYLKSQTEIIQAELSLLASEPLKPSMALSPVQPTLGLTFAPKVAVVASTPVPIKPPSPTPATVPNAQVLNTYFSQRGDHGLLKRLSDVKEASGNDLMMALEDTHGSSDIYETYAQSTDF